MGLGLTRKDLGKTKLFSAPLFSWVESILLTESPRFRKNERWFFFDNITIHFDELVWPYGYAPFSIILSINLSPKR